MVSASVGATTYVPIVVGDITVIIPVDDPPVAENDSVSVNEDTSILINVLANDSDEAIDSVTINIVGQLNKGGLSSSISVSNNQIQYRAPTNWNGTDSFTYTVTDENGNRSGRSAPVCRSSARDIGRKAQRRSPCKQVMLSLSGPGRWARRPPWP